MLKESVGMRPDIIVLHPGGLPVVIEVEIEPARTVEKDAQSRLRKTLSSDGRKIEQAIALRVPEHLVTVSQEELLTEIENSNFRFCFLFDHNESNVHTRWPKKGWIEGNVNDLADIIEHAALSESIIARGMEILEEAIKHSADLLRHKCSGSPAVFDEIADLLKQKDSDQTMRMAMAILVNAVYFYSTIADAYKLKNFYDLKNEHGRYSKPIVMETWDYVLNEINYWPIFKIAREILSKIPDHTIALLLEKLVLASSDLQTVGTTSQHDLSGRMFQRLITDRKFLATFYTLPSSASLLAELAVSRLDIDWSDVKQISRLRIADFACGTGALLNASYGSVASRYRRLHGDDKEIHAIMMENVLVGCDIMPATTHLTAAIISSVHSSLPFRNTQIITLPYGERHDLSGQPISIGALDLIEEEEVLPIFNTGVQQLKGNSIDAKTNVSLPHNSFNLVIMNPPFTRPTNSEGKAKGVPIPSFAGFSTKSQERRLMSKKLAKMQRKTMAGHGNAGLASNFIDLANMKVKKNGILALVLPATFASGESWVAARRLLESEYSDVTVISIAATGLGDTAFSADTSISEVMIVANKRTERNTEKTPILYVNLESRPVSIVEAFGIAKAVKNIRHSDRMGMLHLGGQHRIGAFIKSHNGFNGSFAILNPELADVMTSLERSQFKLLLLEDVISLPMTYLESLGERGIYYRDLHGKEKDKGDVMRGPFDILDMEDHDVPTYPILWAHNAKNETKIVMKPDKFGVSRANRDQEAKKIWIKYASRLCYNEDFGFASQPLAACITSQKAIGGRAWSGFICDDSKYEVPLALWANSTLGLISFWWKGSRQQPGRSMISITKLCSMMTIDVRQFSQKQFQCAEKIFDRFKKEDLLPANEAYRDDIRKELDYAVLIELLGLPEKITESIDLLRLKWCSEPSVHGGKSTSPMNTQGQL